MARLTAPLIDWANPTIQPQAEAVVVTAAHIMPGGPPAIYTREVLASPAFNQLINDPGVSYPF